MANNATITFTQPGVQPPVYVTSSLSGWAPLEMDVVGDEKTPGGDIVFRKHFTQASEGSHQYKIRIGQDHWVLDESKETATDDQGIRNNVIHTQPLTHASPSTATPDATTVPEATSEKQIPVVSSELSEKTAHDRKDSMEEVQLHIPTEPAADAEPTAEQIKVDSPVDSETNKTPDVPLAVEKVDDKPAHGDDVETHKTPHVPLAVENVDDKPAHEEDVETRETPDVPLVVVEKVEDKLAHEGDIENHKTPDVPLVVVEKVEDKLAHEGDIENHKTPDVPLVVVEKVEDKLAHEGDVETNKTPDVPLVVENVDDESTHGDVSETHKTPDVPLVVVEKVDDKPAHGDDFGEDATTAQKVAHDLRAPDPVPDKLTITSDFHVEPGTDQDQAAPLFRHESIQADEPPLSPVMDTIDEESTQSSADHTSSGDAMDTPSEQEEEASELDLAPLLSHETGMRDQNELQDTPLLPHEAGEDSIDKVDHAPISEQAIEDDGGNTTDPEGEDELDRYPLLSHEGGFSDYKGSLVTTEYEGFEDEEPEHYMPYDEDRDDDGDAPLLPHERESAVASDAGSTFSQDDVPFSLESQPSFGYESDRTKELFNGSGRQDIFRSRTNSSKLPHRIPQSDAEDENLNDPSLERFPTNRDQIFERVASIGLHLPEDEAMHDHPQSPQPSVLSQACSSVDLVPVKSYTSLASVPEADDSDEDGDDNGNAHEQRYEFEALSSPVYISQKRIRMEKPTEFARDPNATPVMEEGKQLGQPADLGEAESVDKHDGANDVSCASNALHDAISKVETKTTAKETHPVAELDSELRQRRVPAAQSPKPSDDSSPPPPPAKLTAEDKVAKAVSASALAQQPENRNDNLFAYIFGAVFGRLGRFLTACIGDRKRAR
ncbi:hypothetical protein PTNB85_07648 [Pyrenophora teres f. teres]|nr:hypothetical protein PTNB85_07648 [Pyrenophora teres f. teres]KAE8856939.1 hypothetical protein PTNB29_08006 [Pyrenophora teres f. teres]